MLSIDYEKKGNKFSCLGCNKQYTRKGSLDNHKILCEFKMKTKREKQIDEEEFGDIPNHYELVKIVQSLTIKLIKTEEKLLEMEKWVEKKKKKINVITWLNTNIIPIVGFKEWVVTMILVKPQHFENLLEDSLFNTIQKVFESNLTENNVIYPIKCFSQKQGIFYICEKHEEDKVEWKQLTLQDMILILKTIQNQLIKELTNWKKKNQAKFDDNSKISDIFNKAVIKLMSMTFTQDTNLTRIKNGLYDYLKTDLKLHMDYEFEF